jgi:hypothetical protein
VACGTGKQHRKKVWARKRFGFYFDRVCPTFARPSSLHILLVLNMLHRAQSRIVSRVASGSLRKPSGGSHVAAAKESKREIHSSSGTCMIHQDIFH